MSSGTLKQFPLEDEYKKDTRVTPEDIHKLREWMKTQPHLPEKFVTDLDLILMHHCCDGDLEKSKQLIDTRYTLKTNTTLLFKDRVFDSKIEKVLNTILLQPLPRRTKDGYAIFFSCIMDCNPQNYNHVDTLRALAMSYDMWQYEEGTWPGLVMVSDLTGLTFSHVFRMHLSAMQHFFNFLQRKSSLNSKPMQATSSWKTERE